MLRNVFLSSLRSIVKTKSTSALNIAALSIAISACMVAYFHITNELSYDRFHENSDRIFRVVTGNVAAGEGWVKVSAPIPVKIKNAIPEIESFTRLTEFSYNEKVSVAYEEKVFNESFVYLADQSLLEMFDFETLSGKLALDKSSILISDEIAKKYFGQNSPIGERLTIDSRMSFDVIGVYKSMPHNSHFDPQFIVSFENLEIVKPGTSLTGNWGQFNYFAYVLLKEGANDKLVTQKIQNLVAEYGNGQSMKFEQLNLQPLVDIHFQHNRGNIFASYDRKYLFIYGAIALAILMISFANFMNLSIATSTRRIKEVGVRKVLGANKFQITAQFVSESVITAVCSSLIAAIVLQMSFEQINAYMGSSAVYQFSDPLLIFCILGLIALIGLFAGLYISLYILSISPVSAIKGFFKIGNKGKNFKSGLLIVQFAISSVLILSSIFIYHQLNYISNSDIGMQQSGIMTIKLFDEKSQDNIDVLISELKSISGIEDVSASRFTPGSTNWHQTVSWPDQKEDISWNLISVDENFFKTYEIELLEGSYEDIQNKADHQKYTYILNEAALKESGWESAVGKTISAFGKNGYAPVAAVAKNFNYKSLHNPIEPVVLYVFNQERYSQVSIKFNTSKVADLISDVENKFYTSMPGTPFEYEFADQQFAQLYEVEQQTSRLVGLLTVIAVILAMMGIFAMLTFTIKERTKEIAIRKILGIRITQTIELLSKSYLKLMLVGNLIGLPLTWYLIQIWLQNFSYHIELSYLALLIPPALTLILMGIVVGFKSQQVERINPINALRYE